VKTQAETAAWMGYETVEKMNAEHDQLHADLCSWLGIESQSLKVARGEALTEDERELAYYEEDAVLYVQRLRQMARKSDLALS
jgi:hypothetical protein